jgi:hypothetical protein
VSGTAGTAGSVTAGGCGTAGRETAGGCGTAGRETGGGWGTVGSGGGNDGVGGVGTGRSAVAVESLPSGAAAAGGGSLASEVDAGFVAVGGRRGSASTGGTVPVSGEASRVALSAVREGAGAARRVGADVRAEARVAWLCARARAAVVVACGVDPGSRTGAALPLAFGRLKMPSPIANDAQANTVSPPAPSPPRAERRSEVKSFIARAGRPFV